MPRLLFLAYPFPPSPAIGAVRAWLMAKYLSRLGWEVTVVTPRPAAGFSSAALASVDDQCREEGIQRLFAGRLVWGGADGSLWSQPKSWVRHQARRVMGRLWRTLGLGWDEVWLMSCIRILRRLQPGDFDLVLATGSPFSSFVAARWVARRLRIPFVLDYRDPWTLNGLYHRPWPSWVRSLEQSINREAAAMLMVSPSQAAAQARAFDLDRPPVAITNGYDPERFSTVTACHFDHFALVYAGEFYVGQREIDPILLALKDARERVLPAQDTLPIKLHYYGGASQQVRAKSSQYGVADLVECHGLVSRDQALAAVKGSSLTLVIAGIADTADEVERGIVTGKIFEPLGLGVRILLIAPEGSDAAAIVDGAGAGRCFRASGTAAMATWLIDCARQVEDQAYPPPPSFAWPALAKRLDEVLGGCMALEIRPDRDRYPVE